MSDFMPKHLPTFMLDDVPAHMPDLMPVQISEQCVGARRPLSREFVNICARCSSKLSFSVGITRSKIVLGPVLQWWVVDCHIAAWRSS